MTPDERFAFDVQGYLHLRHVLSPAELAEYAGWMAEVEKVDLDALQADVGGERSKQINRPVSRVIDADHRFARFLDHSMVVPYVREMLGDNYRHIDNELYYTYPGYPGGPWHRGLRPHPTGHVVNEKFICPMVKVFYCMSDVGPGEGEFEVVPGSHRAQFEVEVDQRRDLPAQHVFNDVAAGDVILFNEGLFHNGRANASQKTRKIIIMNLGRQDAGVWVGYTPKPATLAAVTGEQRRILSNVTGVWREPDLSRS